MLVPPSISSVSIIQRRAFYGDILSWSRWINLCKVRLDFFLNYVDLQLEYSIFIVTFFFSIVYLFSSLAIPRFTLDGQLPLLLELAEEMVVKSIVCGFDIRKESESKTGCWRP